MKINWQIATVLIIIIIVVTAGCIINSTNSPNKEIDISKSTIAQQSYQYQPESADIFGSVSHSMSLDVRSENNPEKILVYKTESPGVSRDLFDKYAKIFNVTGTFREGKNGMSVQTEDLVYSVEKSAISGRVIYNVANRPNDILDSQDKLPTDEEAVRIASQFLKSNNLYPDGAYFRTTDRHYEKSADENGNEILHAGQIEVWFGRKLNNLDVWGTQLSVDIGGNGDIIGYYANWREYAPAGEYPIKSPESAFEELKQTGIRTGSGDASISITEAVLAYRTKAGAYDEDYLEPIWVFSGTASSGKGEPQPVSKFIPALTDDAVKSLSSQ
jgi:hypothetical protein